MTHQMHQTRVAVLFMTTMIVAYFQLEIIGHDATNTWQYTNYGVNLVLAGWWLFEITAFGQRQKRQINVNRALRQIVRLRTSDHHFIGLAKEVGITMTATDCAITTGVLYGASTKLLAKVISVLLWTNVNQIQRALSNSFHPNEYNSQTVFHALAAHLLYLHQHDVKKFIRLIKKDNEWFGRELAAAVQYVKLERHITRLRTEQADFAIDHAGAQKQIAELSFACVTPGNEIPAGQGLKLAA